MLYSAITVQHVYLLHNDILYSEYSIESYSVGLQLLTMFIIIIRLLDSLFSL